MIELKGDICSDFEEASKREWLETNGLGGFASSTVSGANTRRYHGLLTIATDPPAGRVRTVSKLDEFVRIGNRELPLSTNIYPGALEPRGFEFNTSFRLDPFPVWTYQIGDIRIERKIFMVHGRDSTVCVWNLGEDLRAYGDEVSLEIRPLISFSDFHSLSRNREGFDTGFISSSRCVGIRPLADFPEIFFNHNGTGVLKTGFWYRDFVYPIERERGFDFIEDLYQPFALRFDLLEGPAAVIISSDQENFANAFEYEEIEKERRAELCRIAGAGEGFRAHLALAADQFIVARGDGRTVIAGYPWFSDWGRDTMIALNGLTLATNREGIARSVLREYSEHISEGMLPNRFPEDGETPEYNTVDAAFWFFEAIRAYVERSGDPEFVKKHLYEKLAEIISRHVEGTRFNIHAAEDGLLFAGESGTQLTWMDAKYGDEVFTPRMGKPVEIQALWYNALKTMEDFAKGFRDRTGEKAYGEMAKEARKSFNSKFWNSGDGCLYDVVTDDGPDPSIRPNQIFAVSLKHSMLSMYKAKKIVQVVERELFTPYGLRSLSANDQRYRPVYTGGPYERDAAYHQGTVWAWLMGPFIEALRRTYPKGRKLGRHIDTILGAFEGHLAEAGLGQISEIFDGDSPHNPRGCFAQAWSIAEILRVTE